jgi:hypothetical protein
MQSFQPRVEIIHELFKHVWLYYLLQENNMEATELLFYFRKSMPGNVQHFNPRVEIVHVIAKNFNPVMHLSMLTPRGGGGRAKGGDF